MFYGDFVWNLDSKSRFYGLPRLFAKSRNDKSALSLRGR
ncbi:hypothetical protein HFN_0792 [Helicobacter fennelliae MRY12-0050]|uniref:Uncharacterized protein n=1 Tax=Helicobacter fennelliae MRY12-0050 TaxID=1325130 RepID=T1DWM9_9HELI|nr:hypothetical protein HFN_0792 [Helicobacter fennelliae MRY12-0050]